MSRLSLVCALAAALAVASSACGGDKDSDRGLAGEDSGGTRTGSGATGPVIPTTGGTSTGGTGGGGNANRGGMGPYMVPDGYTRADQGGWKLGDLVIENEEPPDLHGDGSDGCGQEILGIVRDFKRGDQDGGHPDFETFTGSGQKGMVLSLLGDDDKPVYNNSAPKTFTTGQQNFDQWYRDVERVNEPYYIFFSLEPNGNKATFSSNAFFPLDGKGFGNQGLAHNYHFTTEVHTRFRYTGGETFAFKGDDDLWVFINKKLAIDLGGLHSQQTDQVVLDDEAGKLGLTKGNVYPLDLFHAERHTVDSNFRIDTNLYFVDCGVIVPSGPVK